MLVNFSNHPSSLWPPDEMPAAISQYGQVEDYPFPNVKLTMDTDEIIDIAKQCVDKIIDILKKDTEIPHRYAVLCQGELTLACAVSNALIHEKINKVPIKVLVATTEEKVIEKMENGVSRKASELRFVRFREYSLLEQKKSGEKQPALAGTYEENREDIILVTCLGTGGYQMTNYVNMEEDKLSSLSISGYAFDAVVSKEKPNKIIFVGTNESGWKELIEKWYALIADKTSSADIYFNGIRALGSYAGILTSGGDSKKTLCEKIEQYIQDKAGFEKVKAAITPYGRNNKELAEYFDVLANALKDMVDRKRKTRIIFDISNGFRSMPMFIMMLVKYIGLIQHREIRYLAYYGMFEGKIWNANEYCTPLVNMNMITDLTDWVNAINEFQNFGSVKTLYRCLENEKDSMTSENQDKIDKLIKTLQRFEYGTNANNLSYIDESVREIEKWDCATFNFLSQAAQMILQTLANDFNYRFKRFLEGNYQNTPFYYAYFQIKLAQMFTEQRKYGPASVMLGEGVTTYLIEQYDTNVMKVLKGLQLSDDEYKKLLFNYKLRDRVEIVKDNPLLDNAYASKINNILGVSKEEERKDRLTKRLIDQKGEKIGIWGYINREKIKGYFESKYGSEYEQTMTLEEAEKEKEHFSLELLLGIIKEQLRNTNAHGLYGGNENLELMADSGRWLMTCINSILADMNNHTHDIEYDDQEMILPFKIHTFINP